jgi:hypothetical protein
MIPNIASFMRIKGARLNFPITDNKRGLRPLRYFAVRCFIFPLLTTPRPPATPPKDDLHRGRHCNSLLSVESLVFEIFRQQIGNFHVVQIQHREMRITLHADFRQHDDFRVAAVAVDRFDHQF